MSTGKTVTIEQYIKSEFGIAPPACKKDFLNHLRMLRTYAELTHCKEDKQFYDNAADILQGAFLAVRSEAAQPQWQPPETAPKDGSTFLADVGYPWAMVCAWNAAISQWIYAEYQVNMVDGEWNDPYFETEYEYDIKAWMPLPKINK